MTKTHFFLTSQSDFSAVESAESMWPGLKNVKTVSSKVEVEQSHHIQSPRDPSGSNGFYLTDIRSRKIQAVNPTQNPIQNQKTGSERIGTPALNPGALTMMPEII